MLTWSLNCIFVAGKQITGINGQLIVLESSLILFLIQILLNTLHAQMNAMIRVGKLSYIVVTRSY
jgi:hypothetical protein